MAVIWGRQYRRQSGRAWLLGVLVMLLCASASMASADAGKRLVVLHRGGVGVDEARRREVDRLVLQAVTVEAGFAAAYASPVPFEDIELAAGCDARQAGCLQRIAATLQADGVMLRDLARDMEGNIQLTLTVHDGAKDGEARRASAQLLEAEHVVRMLVARLYPTQSAAPYERRWDPTSTSSIVGWSSLAVGGGLLAGGIIAGTLSRREHRTYADTPIMRAEDVDRARRHLDSASSRARLATGLFIGGAVTSAVGASILLFNYLRARRTETPSVGLAVGPAPAGISLSVQGAWRGGL